MRFTRARTIFDTQRNATNGANAFPFSLSLSLSFAVGTPTASGIDSQTSALSAFSFQDSHGPRRRPREPAGFVRTKARIASDSNRDAEKELQRNAARQRQSDLEKIERIRRINLSLKPMSSGITHEGDVLRNASTASASVFLCIGFCLIVSFLLSVKKQLIDPGKGLL